MLIWPSFATIFALILYLVVTINVGRARSKYGVKPPAMSGSPDFERVVRVHANTQEQIILFLPLLWLFSWYVNPIAGAILGLIWVGGRILYAWGYYQAAEKRFPGFAITTLSSMVLLLGSLIKLVMLTVAGQT
jgi:glutathione S-transferase